MKPFFKLAIIMPTLFASPVGAAMVVHLPDTATPGAFAPQQSFDFTINGTGFSGGDSISSGVTTLADALAFEMLPQGNGGDQNGRWQGGNFNAASVNLTYGFTTALDQVGSILLWNYSEDFGGNPFNDRGINSANITVTHSGGTTLFENVPFLDTANVSAGTNSIAQQFEFGQTFDGVTSIAFTNLNESNPSNSSTNNLGWGEFAVATVPEPSSAALLGFGGLALILRRRK